MNNNKTNEVKELYNKFMEVLYESMVLRDFNDERYDDTLTRAAFVYIHAYGAKLRKPDRDSKPLFADMLETVEDEALDKAKVMNKLGLKGDAPGKEFDNEGALAVIRDLENKIDKVLSETLHAEFDEARSGDLINLRYVLSLLAAMDKAYSEMSDDVIRPTLKRIHKDYVNILHVLAYQELSAEIRMSLFLDKYESGGLRPSYKELYTYMLDANSEHLEDVEDKRKAICERYDVEYVPVETLAELGYIEAIQKETERIKFKMYIK